MGQHPEGPRERTRRPAPLEEVLHNPLERILGAISDLDAVLTSHEDTVSQRTAEREQLIQEQWRLSKELTALQRLGEEYDALADSHDLLAEKHTAVRAALQSLLTDVKTLAGELRRGR